MTTLVFNYTEIWYHSDWIESRVKSILISDRTLFFFHMAYCYQSFVVIFFSAIRINKRGGGFYYFGFRQIQLHVKIIIRAVIQLLFLVALFEGVEYFTGWFKKISSVLVFKVCFRVKKKKTCSSWSDGFNKLNCSVITYRNTTNHPQ